jgi:sugar phosphate isomerase/epimerase
MRLGVHSTSLLGMDFKDGLRFARGLGVEAVEVACAGVFRDRRYGDPAILIGDARAREAWLDTFASEGLEISALSIHGDPLSPDRGIARTYSREFKQACKLAEMTGVPRLTLLAGLPEGAVGDRTPHWVVGLPPEFAPQRPDIVEWQWEQRVIPYWQEHAKIAAEHGCRLCFEMCAWDVVYNPRTLLRLRDAIGPIAGCNFDPSHLLYQGIDVCEAARALDNAIFLVHAKDTRLLRHNIRVNGYLDVNPQTAVRDRPWTFATAGYGHDELFWRNLIATLRLIGYEDVLSIEHEDDLIGLEEGLEKAARFLGPLVLARDPLTSLKSGAGQQVGNGRPSAVPLPGSSLP